MQPLSRLVPQVEDILLKQILKVQILYTTSVDEPEREHRNECSIPTKIKYILYTYIDSLKIQIM